MKLSLTKVSLILLASVFVISCRGLQSDKPPVHLNQNMDFQDRFNAQEENSFFDNNMAMRMPVEGSIARGNLKTDAALYEGVDENGDYVESFPVELTRDFLYRGKDRYDIYCSVCHGGTGDGQGVIMTGQYGYVPAPSFHRDLNYEMPVGEFYAAITNGIRTMPSYASQIKVEDRWAIVAYIRALQKSQNAPENEMGSYDVDLAELQQVYNQAQAEAEELAEERTVGKEGDVSAERGEQLFTRNACGTCHSVDGTDLVGPSLLGIYESERNFADGSSAVADEDYLYESITQPGAKIVEGFQNAMASYDYLSDDEVQSLVEYIKTISDE